MSDPIGIDRRLESWTRRSRRRDDHNEGSEPIPAAALPL